MAEKLEKKDFNFKYLKVTLAYQRMNPYLVHALLIITHSFLLKI